MFLATAESVLPTNATRLCFANECAAGGPTVFTFQGQRDDYVILHACHRDTVASVLPGFMWSAITRHRVMLILDWAPIVVENWGMAAPAFDNIDQTVAR
jgi:hypothetical protein